MPWTWPEEGGIDHEVERLAALILDGPAVEGVTFLGGEPFAQAAACAELARLVKLEGFSVVTLTGYTIEDILSEGREDRLALLDATDLLVDGPFVPALRDLSRPWTGSSNQRYHFLTDRYASLEGRLDSIGNSLEVLIAPDGSVQVNGMYDPEEVEELLATLGLEIQVQRTPD